MKLKIPLKKEYFLWFAERIYLFVVQRINLKGSYCLAHSVFFSVYLINLLRFVSALFFIIIIIFIMIRCQRFDATTGRCTVKVESCKVKIFVNCVPVCWARKHLSSDFFVGDCDYARLCSCCWNCLCMFCAVSNSMNAHSCKQYIVFFLLGMASRRASQCFSISRSARAAFVCEFLHRCMGGVCTP